MYRYFENNLPNRWVYVKNTILCVVINYYFPLCLFYKILNADTGVENLSFVHQSFNWWQ